MAGDLKNYQLREIFIFQQLVAEIANFANTRQNNSLFMGKKKNTHFKTISHKKSQILQIFNEMIEYLHKKSCT